ncbi:MAG: efflux RND transporter permease subunit [Clostridiales bacterium]|jgi:multidrug efflux pump subunit AcrB|nr:efflux RND transporter permease subunit [Clostridiales bacterium]
MFAKFSVKRPHTVIVAIVLIAILGFLSFRDMGVDFLPNINLPYIVVATPYPGGSSPEAVEEVVTAPLEQVIATAGNIKSITTESYPMLSFIIIEFKGGTDINSALTEINEKIKNFKTMRESSGLLDEAVNSGGSTIPDQFADAADLMNAISDSVVMTVNPTMLPIMKISLYERGKTIAESSAYLEAAAKKLETVDGVSSVDVTGLVKTMYFLNIDNGKIINSVLSAFIDFDAAFDALYDGILALSREAADGRLADDAAIMAQNVQAAADAVFAEMNGLAAALGGAVEDAVSGVAERAADGMFDMIKDAADAAFGGLDADGRGAAEALKNMILDAVSDAEVSFTEAAKTAAVEAVGQFFDGLIISLNAAFDGLYTGDPINDGLIDGLKQSVSEAAEGMREPLYEAARDAAASVSAGVFNGLRESVSAAFDGLNAEGALDEIIEGIRESVSEAIENARAAFKESLRTAVEGSVTDAVQGEINALKAEIDGIIGEAADFADEYLTMIGPAIEDPAAVLYGVLKDAETRVQYKTLYFDALDALFDYAGAAIGEIIAADLLEMALFANDMEMPVGSVGGSTIAVGNKVTTKEELFTLPIATVNIADEILNAVAGLRLSELDAAYQTNALLLAFAESLAAWALTPGASAAGLLSSVIKAVDGAGLKTETLRELLRLYGITSDIFGDLNAIDEAFEDGKFSLSSLLAANEAFGDAVHWLRDGSITLRLDDICAITEIDNGSLLHTILNGVAGVQLSVNKNPTASTAEVSSGVRALLEELAAQNPDLEYVVLEDQGEYIQLVINTILSSLITGGILAVLVLLFFLKKTGPTIVVGLSIVLSLVLAFIMMRLAGIELNIASMGGLVLGVGMLVDNSIVVIENIFSMKNSGKDVFKAAVDGTNQVTEAIVASTLTTVVVFVPLFFTSGIASEIITDLALTMSFAIASSLIVALTFVPMAATTFIKNSDKISRLQTFAFGLFYKFTSDLKKRPKWLRAALSPVVIAGNLLIKETSERDGKLFNIFKKGYKNVLKFCLNKKVVPITVAAVLLGFAALAAFTVNSSILPELDMNTINMHFDVDETKLYEYGFDKNDVLQALMYATDDAVERRGEREIADSSVSVYTGFKIMGSSIEDMSGGLINTDGMFGGTLLGGAVSSGGDLECTVLLNDKKIRKKSAADIAGEIAREISAVTYGQTGAGGGSGLFGGINLGGIDLGGIDWDAILGGGASASGEKPFSDFVRISYSFNSIAEIAALDNDYVQLNVYADDMTILEAQTAALTETIRNNARGVTAVSNTLENRAYEYRLILDKDKVSQKTGGFNATVIMELLRRFTEPASGSAVTLTDADGKKTSYDVTVYSSEREVKKWYRIDVAKLSGADAGRYKNIYVEEYAAKDENGKDTVVAAYYTYDTAGIKWALEKRADGAFVNDGADILLYKKSDTIYYSTEFRDAIASAKDLLYYELPYENFLTGETGTVALYELLSEECIIRSENGEPTDITKTPADMKITKTSGSRYLPITVYFGSGTGVNAVKSEINRAVAAYYSENAKPGGLTYGFSSSTALADEIFSTMFFVLGLGVVFIYLVMVAQFRSLKDPLIIMFTVLLAFTGSMFALVMFGMEISMFSIIAFIVLAGVVVNNGIVFIDYTNRQIAEGKSVREAILKTAEDRLRPILMTALTTIMSLLVMAFDASQAASVLRPMGVAATGGLLYATLLTLIIVPTLFELFNKEKKNGKKRFRLFAENYEYFNKERTKKESL